jgi:hypothetical protein
MFDIIAGTKPFSRKDASTMMERYDKISGSSILNSVLFPLRSMHVPATRKESIPWVCKWIISHGIDVTETNSMDSRQVESSSRREVIRDAGLR